jgi:hypothetical protein
MSEGKFTGQSGIRNIFSYLALHYFLNAGLKSHNERKILTFYCGLITLVRIWGVCEPPLVTHHVLSRGLVTPKYEISGRDMQRSDRGLYLFPAILVLLPH